MNNLLKHIKNNNFDLFFNELNKMKQKEYINIINDLFINNYYDGIDKDFIKLLINKFATLNDLERKRILLNKKFCEILKLINYNIYINSELISNLLIDLFNNKKNLYEVLNFYIINGIISTHNLSYYTSKDFDLFKNGLNELFNYKIDISLIEFLINADKYHNIEYLYYVNSRYQGIFRIDIKKIFDQEFICGIVYHQNNLYSYSLNELNIIYKIYLNLNNNSYNERAFLLAFNIYDKLSVFNDISNINQNFSNILKEYYSLIYHKKDFLLDEDELINKINNINDIDTLKKYLVDLFLLKEEYFSKSDFNIFNKIDISNTDVNYNIILLIKSLFNNDINDIKKRSINLIKDKDLYIKIIKFSLSMPKYFEEELNKSLLQVDNKEKIHLLDGNDFNLLIHVLNAYGTGGDYLNLNNKQGSRQICLSSITDFSMGFVDFNHKPNCPNIILGFNHIDSNSLLSISSYDSDSTYDGYHYSNKSMYFTDIRTNTLLTCYYNEYSVKRTNNLKPDYIVCFSNIDEESIKAANILSIPIILIDEEKYIKKSKIVLDNLYNKAINGDINSISIYLFRMIQYYYTFGYRNNLSDESINIINTLRDIVRNINSNNKNELLELLYAVNEFIVSDKLSNKASKLGLVKKL